MAGDMETRDDAYRECRAESDGRKLNGYAIVFNSLSQDLGGFRELIDPSAVDRTLSDAVDVRALVDHDSGKVLGRTRNGTLVLKKDASGLRVSIEPDAEISYARDIVRSVQRGDVTGMSFGFRVIDDSWDRDENGMDIRTVLDMRISEVSIVAFPAYADTSVAMRSLNAFKATQKNMSVAWLTKVHRTRLAK